MPRLNLRQTTALVSASAVLLAALMSATSADVSINAYGTPGLIEMPSARVAPDAQLTTTLGLVSNTRRSALDFQIAPRLSGTFRYSGIQDFDHSDSVDGVFYDRSFDIRYQLLRESKWIPAVTVGLQDFAGTGLFSAEYVVATKQIAPGLDVTGGVGWGRLGSYNSFGSTGTRDNTIVGSGGSLSTDQWFRGDMAAFGGVSYAPNDRLRFKVEYSSDDYVEEQANADFKRESPWNFGVDYRFKSGTQLSFYHTYGTTFGAQVSFQTNLKASAVPGTAGPAPQPVGVRSAGQRSDLGWTNNAAVQPSVSERLTTVLAKEGIVYEGLELTGTSATIRIHNRRYQSTPQAIGRTARAMSRILPGSVEQFTVIPVENGMGLSAVKFSRSDLESLENAQSAELLAQTQIVDAFGLTPDYDPAHLQRFTWSLSPIMRYSYFDPQSPIRADARLQLAASYRFTPNLVLDGAVSYRLFGNLADSDRESNSVLPHVRTDTVLYEQASDSSIDRLTLAHYGRPAENIYSRVTVGYLEQMFAGVSTEVLWKPTGSRLALGAELNYAVQRDFDQAFGLQDYDVFTGHASAYYEFGSGYVGQLDVGQYLAGDKGATATLTREFDNGWKVGAFATMTDVSAEDFGEGSFDKGIIIQIPLQSLSGKPTKATSNLTIRPITRDGGARLNVQGRLYDQVKGNHAAEIVDTWGTFWR